MKTVYVVPSYKRADILRKNTLHMLEQYNIPYDDMYVFIANDSDEVVAYDYLTPLGVHVVQGPIGLKNMRNFITSYFPEGTHMVCIDDDVKDLVFMREDPSVENRKSCKRYPLSSVPKSQFKQWINDTFEIMSQQSVQLFGVYPIRNGYFMKSLPELTTDLRFCVGAFWGCINDHSIQLTLDEKEDTERTLQSYVKYEKILRYNHVAPITRYYKTKGGMQSNATSRIEAGRVAAEQIVATYPNLCSITNYKKSGTYEVRLRTQLSDACPIQMICFALQLPTRDPSRETQSLPRIPC